MAAGNLVLDSLFNQKVCDVTPALITVFNPQSGDYIYVNNAIKSILGYEEEEFMKGGFQLVSSLLHPADSGFILEQNKLAIELANSSYPDYDDNKVIEFEYRMQHKNGTYKWIHTYAIVFKRDDLNNIEQILNISVDITERKNSDTTNQALKLSEDYFRELSDKVPFMIWKVDENGAANYVNKTWMDFTGLNFAESMGYNWLQAVHVEDQPQEKEGFSKAFNEKISYHSKFRLLRKDGQYRWVLGQSNPLFNPDFVGYIGSLTDITDQEIAQQETSNLLAKKDEFLSIASHELKTPLTSIKASIQIIERLSEEQSEKKTNADPIVNKIHNFIGKANRQVSKLTSLVEDLLDVTKIQAGKMELNKRNFVINEVIENCLDQVRGGNDLHEFIVEGETGAVVNADKDRIEQIITNFISNAIKYSPSSNTIHINIKKTENDLSISVKDQGIGIPANKIPFLFDRFFRVQESSQKFSGLGLGLYISAEIVNRHGGRIGVNSEPGNGSTFWFTIPDVTGNHSPHAIESDSQLLEVSGSITNLNHSNA